MIIIEKTVVKKIEGCKRTALGFQDSWIHIFRKERRRFRFRPKSANHMTYTSDIWIIMGGRFFIVIQGVHVDSDGLTNQLMFILGCGLLDVGTCQL